LPTKQELSPNQREASEAPADPVSHSVIGQSAQASSKPEFLTSRNELAEHDVRKHRKIDLARWS
jgi:hypothetical protein